jgi:glycerol-3-phosphate dehydrogenase
MVALAGQDHFVPSVRIVAGTTDPSTAITMIPEPHEDKIQFILDAISDYRNVQVWRR